jgi:hypothetical protein
MNEIHASVDEVIINHRHGDAPTEMSTVDDERVDGLRVREYACSCGFAAAVLSRVDGEEPGKGWPFVMHQASRRAAS